MKTFKPGDLVVSEYTTTQCFESIDANVGEGQFTLHPNQPYLVLEVYPTRSRVTLLVDDTECQVLYFNIKPI